MPMVDMPLSKLKNYRGTNPCPADFDAYWESALEEMRQTDLQIERVPAPYTFPNAECFDLYYTGVGGARIYAKYLQPKIRTGPVPAILQFHGYTDNSGNWMDKLSFVNMGFAVAAMDCRGQGGRSEEIGGVLGNTFHGHFIRGLHDHPKKLLFRQVFLDAAQLAAVITTFDEVDGTRLASAGGSQGGGLAIACAALDPRITKVISAHPFLCDYRRVWDMDLDQSAYAELREYFRHFDPLHEQEDETFNTLGYIDIQHLAPRVKADVLFGATQLDTTCPPSTQFAAFNKLGGPKKMLLYPDFGHEIPRSFWDMAARFLLN